MKIKKGASLAGLQIQMRKVLIEADALWKENGQELVVTEGTGGTHSVGSLHYYGYALDLRTRDFDDAIKPGIAAALKGAVGKDYDVILHKTHIHVEYDKAKYL
jgi:hypothetical protein